jgi:hypothetical protein
LARETDFIVALLNLFGAVLSDWPKNGFRRSKEFI